MILPLWTIGGVFVLISKSLSYDENVYPKEIPHFPVRIDHYSGKPVERGVAYKLPGVDSGRKLKQEEKLTIPEFRRLLQCIPEDYNVDSRPVLGILNRTKLSEDGWKRLLARLTLDPRFDSSAAVYSERDIQRVMEVFQTASITRDCYILKTKYSSFRNFGEGVFKVIDGELYYDYPWGSECFLGEHDFNFPTLILMVLSKVKGYKNSLFVIGACGTETECVSYAVPIPHFSCTASLRSSDLMLEWFLALEENVKAYKILIDRNIDIKNSTTFHHYIIPHQKPWDKRLDKAIVYGALMAPRHILYHLSLHHPDIIDSKWHGLVRNGVGSLNPQAIDSNDQIKCLNNDDTNRTADPTKFGYRSELPKACATDQEANTKPGHYKYIIIPMGSYSTSGGATSLRIWRYLHSGAVIMLQESELLYRFSYHFKPWVHYVPVSFSGLDVIEKIQWLRDHDDMARQLAQNARNFADSFLRLEDELCFMDYTLDKLGQVLEGSEALKPFRPLHVCSNKFRQSNFMALGAEYC